MKQRLALIGLLALSSSALAAEVDGTLVTRFGAGAQDAEITVICGDFKKTVFTSMSGDFYVGDVPDKAACTLTIRYQSVSSEPHNFTTTSGDTSFNRRIEPYDGKLVFIPEPHLD